MYSLSYEPEDEAMLANDDQQPDRAGPQGVPVPLLLLADLPGLMMMLLLNSTSWKSWKWNMIALRPVIAFASWMKSRWMRAIRSSTQWPLRLADACGASNLHQLHQGESHLFALRHGGGGEGCQQLLEDELARLTASLTQDGLTSVANVELKQIKAVSSHLNNHIDDALQEIQPEGDQLPLPLEQDVVRQTYVVGRQEILAEKAAWVDAVRQEVQSLENTGTVKPAEDQRPVEVIPGK
eukprot:s4719_g4.t1